MESLAVASTWRNSHWKEEEGEMFKVLHRSEQTIGVRMIWQFKHIPAYLNAHNQPVRN